MFVVPPVTAWLMTDRLAVMIVLSVMVGVVSAVVGHLSAITVPWFGGLLEVMVSSVNGLLANRFRCANWQGEYSRNDCSRFWIAAPTCCSLLAPRKGILSRGIRSLRVALQILSEDVLAAIYRAELQGQTAVATKTIRGNLLVSAIRARLVLVWLKWNRLVIEKDHQLSLDVDGRRQAQNIVRSHRLWEQYLASEASGLTDRELHAGAERFEHFYRPKIARTTQR